MISIRKKLIVLVLFITICFTNVFAIVSPTSQFFVNDYAELLSNDTKQYIITTNTKLEYQTGAQVVVVTVPSLNGLPIEEYSTTLFRNFGIGDRTKNNGVLLLLALNEREFRIEVGYGLEGILTDSKTGRIQDQYIIPYLKNNQWNEGIKNGFDAIILEICNEYNIASITDLPIVTDSSQNKTNELFWVLPVSVIIGAVFGIIARAKKCKTFKAFLLTLFCSGLLGTLAYLITPHKSLGFTQGILGVFANLISFLSTLSGITTHLGTGNGGSSRYSGGGGRSGGGGSTRHF